MTTAGTGSPSTGGLATSAATRDSRGEGRSARAWTWVAAVEVVLGALVILADRFLPALVLLGMALVSLALRRRGPRSLGFRRPAHPWRLVAQMAGFAAAWSLLNVALLIPVVNHASGQQQDVSAFADLEGNLGLLLVYLAAAWVVAAFCEEVAFRGYLLTRITDVLGRGRGGVMIAVTISSVLFGLLHTEQGLVGATVSALAGAVFSTLRYRCHTLWAPILAHGFDDTIGFIWFFFFGPVYGLW